LLGIERGREREREGKIFCELDGSFVVEFERCYV
jgi:hypothetical protein